MISHRAAHRMAAILHTHRPNLQWQTCALCCTRACDRRVGLTVNACVHAAHYVIVTSFLELESAQTARSLDIWRETSSNIQVSPALLAAEKMEKDLQSRFTHLLQPIRDLTKNWDVDVASQLEEYLTEV